MSSVADPVTDFETIVQRVRAASDLFGSVLDRDPEFIERLRADDGSDWPVPPLPADDSKAWPRLLRQYRKQQSARIIWRDVLGMDTLPETMQRISNLADVCMQAGLAAIQADFELRHGVVRDAQGHRIDPVIFGLGKLGGGELNFSSDVDLVIGFEEHGESDGPRPLAAETYFTRLCQQWIKLLDEVTVDGFCHRVDMRLRPYGNSGRLVWSFAAMELYFQSEGRDWERYAWQKARVVAGDVAAGARFLNTLRPFVYRRYLDFTALDGVREMKASIQAEVARNDRQSDIKRGPGGIREIEFLVQALQLIRGGRDASLRTPSLLKALDALVAAGELTAENADQLRELYRFLRVLENRIQMLRDEQTHDVPAAASDRERVAIGLGYANWDALQADLDVVRTAVQQEFNALLAPRKAQAVAGSLQDYWRALPDHGDGAVLQSLGYADALAADTALRDLLRGPGVRQLSPTARARFDRVMQVMVEDAGRADAPLVTLKRLISLLQAILRRSAYIALLDEQPAALKRLVQVVGESALMAERVSLHPLLLDELLDTRAAGSGMQLQAVELAIDEIVFDGDPDLPLRQLNEIRQTASFRAALAFRDGRIDAHTAARQLADLAQLCLMAVFRWVRTEMQDAHGALPGAEFAAIGYGSLGARELNFGSDLDLVFLYDAPADAVSTGPRPLDAARYFARLAQKLVAYLAVQTAAGHLFEVDMRLRPDGAKGLLVSSFSAYAQYQRERAWTWEHQALVRSRPIAGDAQLCERFTQLRAEILSRPRDVQGLHDEIAQMRARMRKELDRSSASLLDLKQGRGALVDLEFHLQQQVLEHAAKAPQWLDDTGNLELLQRLDGDTDALRSAYLALLDQGLRCGLDRRPRLVPRTPAIEASAAVISARTPAFAADPSVTSAGR